MCLVDLKLQIKIKVTEAKIYLEDEEAKLYCKRKRRNEKTEDLLHEVPNVRVRKGVPLQQVPHEEKEDRDSSCVMSDREADKNLVPEQADEVEKGTQDGQYEYRSLSHESLRSPLSI
ncbi:hypothetical protein D910_10392 [Dendroctonus ponderosae]